VTNGNISELKIQEPRYQEPKKEYKRKPRIKERMQKLINLKASCESEALEI
jgi:hypothetical protein